LIDGIASPKSGQVNVWLCVAIGVVAFAVAALVIGVPLAAASAIGVFAVIAVLRSTFFGVLLLLVMMLFSPEVRVASGLILRGEELLLPVLLVAIAARMLLPQFRRTFRIGRLGIPLIAIVLVNAIASLHGIGRGYVEPFESLSWNLKACEFFLIYLLAVNAVEDPRDIADYLNLIILVLVGIVGYAYLQIPGTEVHTLRRLTAPFEGNPEPTTLGGYLTLILGIVIAMALHAEKVRSRVLWWGLSLFVLVPIVFTLSRTTYVSCLVMILALGIAARRMSILVGLGMFVVLSPLLLPDKVIARVLMTFSGGGAMGLDSSSMERINVWAKAWDSLKVHPFLGSGLPSSIIDSQFVRTIVESGLVGLCALVAMLVACVRMGVRLKVAASDPLHKGLAIGYVAGTVSLVLHAFAATTFWITRIVEPFMFISGIVAALESHYSRQGHSDVKVSEESQPKEVPVGAAGRSVVSSFNEAAGSPTLSRGLDMKSPPVVDLTAYEQEGRRSPNLK
jgi:O-antigen ligase